METKKLKVEFGNYGDRLNKYGNTHMGDPWMRIIKQTHFDEGFGNQGDVRNHIYIPKCHPGLRIMSIPGVNADHSRTKRNGHYIDDGILYVVGSKQCKIPSNKLHIPNHLVEKYKEVIREYNETFKGSLEKPEECIFQGTSRKFKRKSKTIEVPTVTVTVPEVRKLELSYTPVIENGIRMWYGQITEQTHRGSLFAKDLHKPTTNHYFYSDVNGIMIFSKTGWPGFIESNSEDTKGYWLLFARGTSSCADDKQFIIPNRDLLERLQKAVEHYNTVQNEIITSEEPIDTSKIADRVHERMEKIKQKKAEVIVTVEETQLELTMQPDAPKEVPVTKQIETKQDPDCCPVNLFTIHAPYHKRVTVEQVCAAARALLGITVEEQDKYNTPFNVTKDAFHVFVCPDTHKES